MNYVIIVGKCCESGDILIGDINIMDIKSGDIFIIILIGVYGYLMFLNYNKILRVVVVLVFDGNDKIICKR